MPTHKPHRKQIVAVRVNRTKVRRWLIKLDRIFIEIEMKKKDKKK